MQVIATDFVPIVPYSTDIVSISMGQRYDIIVTANATADNYVSSNYIKGNRK